MLFQLQIELFLVLRRQETAKADEDVDVLDVVFEHRHDEVPEAFKVFGLAVLVETAQQVFVVLCVER